MAEILERIASGNDGTANPACEIDYFLESAVSEDKRLQISFELSNQYAFQGYQQEIIAEKGN